MNVAEKPPVANAEIRIPTRTCPGCGEAVPDAEVRANACVCPRCKHYFPMPVRARIAHLTDPDSFRELFDKEIFTDPLNFPDYREKSMWQRERAAKTRAFCAAPPPSADTGQPCSS